MGIFGSKFLDQLKIVGEGLRRKSLLVAQGYIDGAATFAARKAPTIHSSSQRLLMALSASIPDVNVLSRDITVVREIDAGTGFRKGAL